MRATTTSALPDAVGRERSYLPLGQMPRRRKLNDLCLFDLICGGCGGCTCEVLPKGVGDEVD